MSELQRITKDEWANLVLDWEAECSGFEENFEDYATASLPVLEDLAVGPQRREAGVYGLRSGDQLSAICQANVTRLPGYTGKVLRVRHIVLSPRFDFSEEVEIAEYGNALTGVFAGVVGLAYKEMPADHIKFHLRSPAERSFGGLFTKALDGHSAFSEVAIKGSWIYLSKA